jgi:uncharacterized protein (DUF1697 family)
MPKLTPYAAFLRGINVGGNKKVPMADLKKVMEKLGYTNVRTILASGNVCFEAPKQTNEKLAAEIEKALEKKFGFEVGTLVRTIEEIQTIADADPFKGIKVTPETRLYVTFLSEKPKGKPTQTLDTKAGTFKIVRTSTSDICFVLVLKPGFSSPDLMNHLEKEFGKKITTRNWNTVEKVLKK